MCIVLVMIMTAAYQVLTSIIKVVILTGVTTIYLTLFLFTKLSR